MGNVRSGLGVVILVGVSLGLVAAVAPPDALSIASQPTRSLAPPIAIVATALGEPQSEVIVESGTQSTPIGTISHLPDASVRAAVAGLDVLVVADTLDVRDRSWASSLFVVREGSAPRRLVDGVYHASSPLVEAGRVFVQRGELGYQPEPSQMRVDFLKIDEVDLASGSTQTLHEYVGYEAHLAGSTSRELILYRVGPVGADLVAVDLATRAVRVVIDSWPPFARDFSVDRKTNTLVAQQASDTSPRGWRVERIDLATGQRTAVSATSDRDMVPFAWPGARTLIHTAGVRPGDPRRIPTVLGQNIALHVPREAGTLWLRSRSDDDGWVAGLWLTQGSLPVPYALRTSDGTAVEIPHPPGSRVAVAGFVGGAP